MEKLGATSTPTAGVGQPALERGQPLVVEAGRADHRVDAVRDAELEVVHDHVGMGEVDDRLDARRDQVLERVPEVDLGRQLEVVGGLDRPADLGPDLAAGTQHPDSSHC